MKLEKSDLSSDYSRWLKSYMRDLKYKEIAKNTLILYNRILNALEDFIKKQNEVTKLREIDKEFFLDFIEAQEENSKNKVFSKKTKQLYVSILKSFFVYISDNNDEFYTFENEFKMPIKGANKSKKVKYLSDKEVEKIVNYLQEKIESKGLYYDYIYSLGIKLMLFGGLRISEVLQLKLENISLSQLEDDEGKQDMYEIELKETKAGEEQTAIIKIIDIENELEFFRENRENYDDIFISKKNGNRIDRSNYYVGVKNIMNKAGVDKKGLHIYRHTCAMQLYR